MNTQSCVHSKMDIELPCSPVAASLMSPTLLTGSPNNRMLKEKSMVTGDEFACNQPAKLNRAFTTAFGASLFDEKMAENGFKQTYVVGFLYFNQPLDVQETQKVLLKRLCEIPRFRSKFVNTAEEGKRQVTGFQRFSDAHMQSLMPQLIQDKTGIIRTPEDVNRFASEVYQSKTDLSLPLWRAYICNDMADGRSLLIMVIDHAIADGTALIQSFMSILDKDDKAAKANVPTRSKKAPEVGCLAQLKGSSTHAGGPSSEINFLQIPRTS